jgi:dihydrofolate reductase
MKTQYYAASSLDGYIAAPGHSLDWLMQFGDPESTSYPEFIRDVGALAMGSATYEWLLRNLISEQAAAHGPWPYEQPVWVFSSRDLERVSGADIRFVEGDVRPVHSAMAEAAGGKNIWIVGAGSWPASFMIRGCSMN